MCYSTEMIRESNGARPGNGTRYSGLPDVDQEGRPDTRIEVRRNQLDYIERWPRQRKLLAYGTKELDANKQVRG